MGTIAGHNQAKRGSHGIHEETTVITDAQLLALRATAIAITSNAPAGSVIQFLGCSLDFVTEAGSVAAYTITNVTLGVRYASAAGPKVAEDTGALDGWLDTATDATWLIAPATMAARITKATTVHPSVNRLFLHNTGSAELDEAGAAGSTANNILRVRCFYRIIPTLYTT